MADTIQIKGGRGDVPRLADRELGYNKEEKALYIGTENGNVKLFGSSGTDHEARIAALETKVDDIIARLAELEKPPSE